MGEIHVDQARLGNEFGNPLHSLAQNVVGQPKGHFHGHIDRGDLQEAVIGHTDERIGKWLKFLQPFLGILAAAAGFETERSGHNGDDHGSQAFGYPGGDGDRASARATAHSSGEKDHIRTRQSEVELFVAFLSGSFADLRIAAGSQSTGQFGP